MRAVILCKIALEIQLLLYFQIGFVSSIAIKDNAIYLDKVLRFVWINKIFFKKIATPKIFIKTLMLMIQKLALMIWWLIFFANMMIILDEFNLVLLKKAWNFKVKKIYHLILFLYAKIIKYLFKYWINGIYVKVRIKSLI